MKKGSKALTTTQGPFRATDRRSVRTRAALLLAGETLFSDQMPRDVSVQDIVMTADLAKGSFYNHFADKDALADEIMLQIRNRVGLLVENLNRSTRDPALGLARAICAVIRFCLDNRRSANALLNLEASLPSLDEKLNLGTSATIAYGIDKGVFSKVGVEEGTLLTIGSCAITIQHCLTRERESANALAIGMIAGVLRALGVSPARAGKISRQAVEGILIGDTAVGTATLLLDDQVD